MLPAERRQFILQRLREQRSVRVSDLCGFLDVADETIRRDLSQLEAEGLVERVHGGAVLSSQVRVAHPYDQRRDQAAAEKQCIAQIALSLIADGTTVLLDTGTTTLEIARQLRGRSGITVVTPSPYIGLELAPDRRIRVMLTGGVLDPDSMSLVGPDAERYIEKLGVDVAFVGASGVSRDRAFTASSVYDAHVKSVITRVARSVYVVADGSKIGTNSLVPYADIQEVSGLITDTSADRGIIESLRGDGLTVMLTD